MDALTEALNVFLCKNAENIRYKRRINQKLAVEPEIILPLLINFDVLKMWLFISVLYQIVTNFRQMFVKKIDLIIEDTEKTFNQDHENKKSDKYWTLWYKNFVVLKMWLLISVLYQIVTNFRRTAVAQWLRCCATNREVAGSIPDSVIVT